MDLSLTSLRLKLLLVAVVLLGLVLSGWGLYGAWHRNRQSSSVESVCGQISQLQLTPRAGAAPDNSDCMDQSQPGVETE